MPFLPARFFGGCLLKLLAYAQSITVYYVSWRWLAIIVKLNCLCSPRLADPSQNERRRTSYVSVLIPTLETPNLYNTGWQCQDMSNT